VRTDRESREPNRMLPENLKDNATAAAVEAFDTEALVSGKLDRGELTLEVAREQIVKVARFLKEELRFVRVSTVTGVDWYPAEPRFEVVYHLHSPDRNERLRVKCRLPGADPEIDSVTSVWRGANWFEREVFDLFGVRFRNHPDLRRIMLPDDWEGHPLRKDYDVMGPRA
jgi:NADH-quinone oxidoreductase subunit C